MNRDAHFLVDSRRIYPDFNHEELLEVNDLINNKLNEIDRLEQEAKQVSDKETLNELNEKLAQLRHEVEERKKDHDAVLEAGQFV